MMVELLVAGSLLLSAAANAQSDGDDLAIYTSVLRFFRPAGSQIRWIDPRLGRADVDSSQTLSSALTDSLVRKAGRHFELLPPGIERDRRSGGVVRLSRIVRLSPDSVRVVAQYQHHTPYYTHPEIDLPFLVVKRKGKWVLIRP